MIDYRLKTFLALCKLGNYTKTAELLHITQPAVTQHIKYLEEYYNCKLFEYSNKTLHLTEAGKELYSFTMSMHSSSERIKLLINNKNNEKKPITFGATLTIGEYIMPPILEKLIIEYPNLHTTMNVQNTKTLLDKLNEGEIDFALIEGNFNKYEYNHRLFSEENFIGVCSSNSVYSNKSVYFEDLFDERIILREFGSGTRDIFEHIMEEKNMSISCFKNFIELGNMNVIKDLVEKNLGITFVYEEAVKKELNNGQLLKINIYNFNETREFNFVYHKNSLHEQEFLEWYEYFKANHRII